MKGFFLSQFDKIMLVSLWAFSQAVTMTYAVWNLPFLLESAQKSSDLILGALIGAVTVSVRTWMERKEDPKGTVTESKQTEIKPGEK